MWTELSHKIFDNFGGNGNCHACNLSWHLRIKMINHYSSMLHKKYLCFSLYILILKFLARQKTY